jgi:aromatic ring hydroxylase
MIKTGTQHIASLRDGREVYLDGELVADVTTHPAFRGAVASIGRMFDFQSAPENRDLMTFETDTGTRANRIWELPGSYEARQAPQGSRGLDRTACGIHGARARSRRVVHRRHVYGSRGVRGL